MGYEYVKDSIIKDKSENEKKLELIVSIIKTRNDLQNANNNYEYAEGDLIDYFLYEIKPFLLVFIIAFITLGNKIL